MFFTLVWQALIPASWCVSCIWCHWMGWHTEKFINNKQKLTTSRWFCCNYPPLSLKQPEYLPREGQFTDGNWVSRSRVLATPCLNHSMTTPKYSAVPSTCIWRAMPYFTTFRFNLNVYLILGAMHNLESGENCPFYLLSVEICFFLQLGGTEIFGSQEVCTGMFDEVWVP